ncbi:MAG: hypothetical protein ACXAAO_06120 [Candidatus Thorarchaeota archaeon]|jgi:hypothetical protein
MTDEEKYRVETPEEEVEEKKGFFRPLPEKEKPKYVEKDGRPQPIVQLLGLSMREKTRDNVIMILIPALVGFINTTIYSLVITNQLENSGTFLFFIPILVAIPIGLTAAEAGQALMGAFFGAMFFLLFFVLFLSSPGIVVPELGIDQFLISAIMISIAYFILMVLATLLGAVIGIIVREFA